MVAHMLHVDVLLSTSIPQSVHLQVFACSKLFGWILIVIPRPEGAGEPWDVHLHAGHNHAGLHALGLIGGYGRMARKMSRGFGRLKNCLRV